MKSMGLAIVFLLMLFEVHAQSRENISYKRGKLLYKEDFDNGLKNWVPEFPSTPASPVTTKNNKLLIDVNGGVTIWLNKKLSGNLVITYKRKVIVDTGRNDRLSDLNQFWMATDPRNENLFTRSGDFGEYDSLSLYYVGFGGNSNTTTRFRKYTGNGERVLYVDLSDKEHLLKANKEYSLKTVVYNGLLKFFVDDKEFFSFRDTNPIRQGYFGFRTTQSRQEVYDFKIYRLR